MTNRHVRSRRKETGGLRRRSRKYRKYEKGSDFTATDLAEKDIRTKRSRGGEKKNSVKAMDYANLSDGEETRVVEIENVLENPANPDYVRRDLLTRGTVIETEEGKARVTSRPGQDGTVNAVLLEDN